VKVAYSASEKGRDGRGRDAVVRDLQERWNCQYDVAGNIGRRYRRQDEIGTPFCVTVDFDSLEDKAATIRDRDTTEQVRIGLDNVKSWLFERLK